MTLTDAGPLIAIIDKGDGAHARCVRALSLVSTPLVSTVPVLTEALYVLGNRVGWAGQRALFQMVLSDRLLIEPSRPDHLTRAEELMAKYVDLPMDFADATLVALAEDQGLRRIFTTESDFGVYRLNGRQPFEVLP